MKADLGGYQDPKCINEGHFSCSSKRTLENYVHFLLVYFNRKD